jgi:hypothetical protein
MPGGTKTLDIEEETDDFGGSDQHGEQHLVEEEVAGDGTAA